MGLCEVRVFSPIVKVRNIYVSALHDDGMCIQHNGVDPGFQCTVGKKYKTRRWFAPWTSNALDRKVETFSYFDVFTQISQNQLK